ncbi:MAG: HlyD family secretion protein [Candidatus Eremiobacteraeota bacterium]|nr:HlyD family secretion protein [Candidatus Eremiobacteraeota bacterium]
MDSRSVEEQRRAAPDDGSAQATPEASAPPATPEKASRSSNPTLRRVGLIVAAIVVIFLLIWGIRYFLYARTHASTDDAKVDASSVLVTSKISERVNRILVDTDQQVRKGQLLIQLDDQDERSKYEQAKASVTAQRAQAAAAQASVALTQETVAAQSLQGIGGITQAQSGQGEIGAASAAIGEAQAAVPAAQQAYARAEADLARTQSLVSTGDLPRQQLDAARASAAAAAAQYDQALAGVAAARDKLASAQAQATGSLEAAHGKYQEASSPGRVAASEAQARAAYATVASLQAQMQLASDQLTNTRIVAPVDGYIGEKNVEVGQTVAPGNALLTIIPAQHIFITANYKETQIGEMRAGQPVDIAIDAYKGVPFHGHVIAINPASQNTYSLIPAQNASGNFIKVTQRIPVKISIDDPRPDMPLRPGMSVETSVRIK